MRVVTKQFAFLLIVLVLGAFAYGGCGGEGGEDAARTEPSQQTGTQTEVRLSPAEKDTLRAMVERLGVTREEYWEGQGGVLANDHFELWYPPGMKTVTHGMYALDILEKARAQALRVFGRVPEVKLKVVCTKDLGDFKAKCGGEWWNYARIKGDQITYQPVTVLFQRGLAPIAIPHQYFVWLIGKMSRDRVPLWVSHGLASSESNERATLDDQINEFSNENAKLNMGRLEAYLESDRDRKWSRIANYNAFRMVDNLISIYDRRPLVDAILLMGDGKKRNEAFQQAFTKSYDEVTAEAMVFKIPKPNPKPSTNEQ